MLPIGTNISHMNVFFLKQEIIQDKLYEKFPFKGGRD